MGCSGLFVDGSLHRALFWLMEHPRRRGGRARAGRALIGQRRRGHLRRAAGSTLGGATRRGGTPQITSMRGKVLAAWKRWDGASPGSVLLPIMLTCGMLRPTLAPLGPIVIDPLADDVRLRPRRSWH